MLTTGLSGRAGLISFPRDHGHGSGLPVSLLVFIPFADVILWLLVIRPYCIRHGRGYTPGAHTGVTIWVDWQQATELAKTHGHRGMLAVCRVFLGLRIVFCAWILVVLIGSGR